MEIEADALIKELHYDYFNINPDEAPIRFEIYKKTISVSCSSFLNYTPNPDRKQTLATLMFVVMCKLYRYIALWKEATPTTPPPLKYIICTSPISRYTCNQLHKALIFLARSMTDVTASDFGVYIDQLFSRITELYTEDEELVMDAANIFGSFWKNMYVYKLITTSYPVIVDVPCHECDEFEQWLLNKAKSLRGCKGTKMTSVINKSKLDIGDVERHIRNNNGVAASDPMYILYDKFTEVQIAKWTAQQRLSLSDLYQSTHRGDRLRNCLVVMMFEEFCNDFGFPWFDVTVADAGTLITEFQYVKYRTFPVIYTYMGTFVILFDGVVYKYTTYVEMLAGWIEMMGSVNAYKVSIVEKNWDLSFMREIF